MVMIDHLTLPCMNTVAEPNRLNSTSHFLRLSDDRMKNGHELSANARKCLTIYRDLLLISILRVIVSAA